MSHYQSIQVIRDKENQVIAVAITSLESQKRLPDGRYMNPFEDTDNPDAETVFQPRVSVYCSNKLQEYRKTKYPTLKSMSENSGKFLNEIGVEFRDGPEPPLLLNMPPKSSYIKKAKLAHIGPLNEYYETKSSIFDNDPKSE